MTDYISLDIGDSCPEIVTGVNQIPRPGYVYDDKTIGLFRTVDQGISDEKILAYGTGNPIFRGTEAYTEVQPHILREIEHFFPRLQVPGSKEKKVLGWGSTSEAREVIRFVSAHPAEGAR